MIRIDWLLLPWRPMIAAVAHARAARRQDQKGRELSISGRALIEQAAADNLRAATLSGEAAVQYAAASVAHAAAAAHWSEAGVAWFHLMFYPVLTTLVSIALRIFGTT